MDITCCLVQQHLTKFLGEVMKWDRKDAYPYKKCNLCDWLSCSQDARSKGEYKGLLISLSLGQKLISSEKIWRLPIFQNVVFVLFTLSAIAAAAVHREEGGTGNQDMSGSSASEGHRIERRSPQFDFSFIMTAKQALAQALMFGFQKFQIIPTLLQGWKMPALRYFKPSTKDEAMHWRNLL